MIEPLTDQIWFGDKPSVHERLNNIKPKAILNVASTIKRPYWSEIGKRDWRVWYFNMGSPDREYVDDNYFNALGFVLDAVKTGDKFPLLCHCRMGGHRGPSAAVFAYWHYASRSVESLDRILHHMFVLRPRYAKPNPHRIYRDCLLDYCRRNST